MTSLVKIAIRNLFRYRRRTLLTTALVVSGVVFVVVFVAVTGSFKSMMIGQITDSFVGHIQIHRNGYLASIDNLPLHLNLEPKHVDQVADLLGQTDGIAAYSARVKFAAELSNFEQTTIVRINGSTHMFFS